MHKVLFFNLYCGLFSENGFLVTSYNILCNLFNFGDVKLIAFGLHLFVFLLGLFQSGCLFYFWEFLFSFFVLFCEFKWLFVDAGSFCIMIFWAECNVEFG